MTGPTPNSTSFTLKEHAPAMMLIIISGLCVYLSSLGHSFLMTWDDNRYIVNSLVIQGFSLHNLITAFTTFQVVNYAPIHTISHMLDYTLWGLNPFGYRAFNLALHLANGTLLYLLIVRIHRSKIWALAAALFFTLHPAQVESVVWVSQRKNLLAMLFFLAAFHSYLNYREKVANTRHYAACIFLFALSCLSKSVAVIFPVILVMYDLLILKQHHIRRSCLNKLPFAAVAAGTALLAVMSQAENVGGGRTGLHGNSMLSHILTTLSIVPDYLEMIFRPSSLSALYAIRIQQTPDTGTLISIALLALGTIASLLLIRKGHILAFWYLTIPVSLLPVAQIVPLVTLRNDRYLYFPMLGIAALVGWCSAILYQRAEGHRTLVIIASAGLFVLVAVNANQRTHVWKNDITLWKDATIKEPLSSMAWSNLGEAYHNSGMLEETVNAYRRSIQLDGTNLNNLNNIVATYSEMGQPVEGLFFAKYLVKLNPASYVGHKNLGIALMEQNRHQEAEQHLLTALRLRPADPAVTAIMQRFKSESPLRK